MKHQAFTLLEILVSLFIIVMLSSMFIMISGMQSRKLALSRSAFRVAQDTRWVQEKAMNAVSFNCLGGGDAYRLGLHIEDNASSYFLFVDCDANYQRDPSGAEDIKEVIMERGVKVFSLYPPSVLDIVFEPPDPTVYINTFFDSEEAVIILQDITDTSVVKSIKVNSAGRIELE